MNASTPNTGPSRTPEEWATAAAHLKSEANAARDNLLASLAEAWASGASTLVDRLVAERASIVNAMDIAEMSILKANLAMAIADGKASIPSVFETALNVDALAEKAKPNVTGNVTVDMQDAVASLSRPLFLLLENAKLRPAAIRRGSSASYQAFSAWDLDMAHKPAEQKFTAATERYGKAKLSHDAAVRRAASEQATKRWNEAEPA